MRHKTGTLFFLMCRESVCLCIRSKRFLKIPIDITLLSNKQAPFFMVFTLTVGKHEALIDDRKLYEQWNDAILASEVSPKFK